MRDQRAHQRGSSLEKWDVRLGTTLEMVKGYLDTYILATFGGISYGEADMWTVNERTRYYSSKSQIDGLHLFQGLDKFGLICAVTDSEVRNMETPRLLRSKLRNLIL